MLHPPTANSARISEIFSSLQGEGTHLGERHLFIRFEECHIHCEYCDELEKPGRLMTLDDVMAEVARLDREEGPHSFVSLTGGEPLLYLPFLKPLMMRLKAQNFRIYLETNGILWHSLQDCIGWCDVIAMDLKPSSVTKEKNFDQDHKRFLEVAKTKESFAKIILSKEIDVAEFENQMRLVSQTAPQMPVVLVPISSEIEGHEDPELMELLVHLQRLGLRYIPNLRIVPRFHKILNIR